MCEFYGRFSINLWIIQNDKQPLEKWKNIWLMKLCCRLLVHSAVWCLVSTSCSRCTVLRFSQPDVWMLFVFHSFLYLWPVEAAGHLLLDKTDGISTPRAWFCSLSCPRLCLPVSFSSQGNNEGTQYTYNSRHKVWNLNWDFMCKFQFIWNFSRWNNQII